jgi:hypothetical protein
LTPTPSHALGLGSISLHPPGLTDSAIRREVTDLEAEDDADDEIHLGLPRELEHSETPGLDFEDVPLEEVGRRWQVGDWAQVRRGVDRSRLEFGLGDQRIVLAPGFLFRVASVCWMGGREVSVAAVAPGGSGALFWIKTDLIEPGGDPAEDAAPLPPPHVASRRPALPSEVTIPSVDYGAMIARLETLRDLAATGMSRAVEVGLKEVIEIARGKAVAS